MLEAEPLARRIGAAGQGSLAQLAEYKAIRADVESFWMQSPNRETSSWLEHADINDVMLATSLAPQGFVELTPPRNASRSRP
jgi:hypothetical protein